MTSQPASEPLGIHSISKSFGAQRVLDEVSLSLKPGEIFGLVGLNGVGKTTLIKIVLDLAQADSGEALIAGLSSREVASRRHISYLPEKFQPSSYLHGFEYLDLVLSYYHQPLDQAAAEALAKGLDLDPAALPKKVSSYSKGMGQKLGLMGAFLVDQPFLILDEPMSGLDPRARVALKARLMEARAKGKTIFFSSHILSDIDEICDRIGVLSDAKMIYVGTPAQFKTRYPAPDLEQSFLQAIAA